MTPQRFEVLADAYGGDVARWPTDERESAAALMISEPAFAQTTLTRASALDDALDAWRPMAATHEFRAKAIAAAPAPRRRLAAWFWGAGLGAGLAAACAAGLAVGVAISSEISQPDEGLSVALGVYDDLAADLSGEDA